jgi:hypothetical protein
VYDNSLEGGNGENETGGPSYSILAGHFTMNAVDANALAQQGGAVIEASFKTAAGAISYKRSGNLSRPEGNIELVSALLRGSDGRPTSVNFNGARSLAAGDVFLVTFRVAEDPSAEVTVRLTISNGAGPQIFGPDVKVVPVGAAFTEGDYTGPSNSYMRGIYATDDKDGDSRTAGGLVITHDSPVNTSVEQAVYIVTYSTTDSDHNPASKRTAVLVGDWTVANGYGISAHDFSKNLSDVAGTQAEVISESEAVAIDLRPELSPGVANPNFGQPVSVVVTNDGGYYGRTSSIGLANGFEITLAVGENRNTVKTINARVSDDRVAIIYYANGGSGNAPLTTLYTSGSRAAVSDQAGLSRTGYTFGGWALTGTGGAAYQAGSTFNIYEDTRLFAVWNAIPVPPAVVPPVTPPAQPPTTVVVQTPPPQVIVQAPTVVTTPGEGGEGTRVEIQVPYEVPTDVPGETVEVIREVPIPGGPASGNWSLVSVLLSLLTFAAAVILAMLTLRRRYDDEDDDSPINERVQEERARQSRRNILTGIIALLGLAPAVVFILLDDISGSLVLVNFNTIFVAIATIIVLILIVIRMVLGRGQRNDYDDGFSSNTSAPTALNS